MKVCIVTVYDSMNSGSYWQAFALKMSLEKMDNDVYLLKRSKKEKFRLNIFHISKTIGLFLLKGPKTGINKVKINHDFWKFQKIFKTINYKKVNDMDLIVIGSDTLWNLNDNYFKRNYKLFFGGQITNKKQITYAISAANTKKEDIKKMDNIDNYINNFSSISVRDNITNNLIKDIYKGRILEVCDPTFLLKREDYKKLINCYQIKEKYLFLYLFEKLKPEEEKVVKEFANRKNLKIVDGVGNKCKSVFSCVNSPMNFITNIFYASYVITDTFHGTIFSINMNKNFVVINHNKNKINDILDKCELSSRLVNCQNMFDTLSKEIDYKDVNKYIEEYRNESIRYLNDALNK